MRRLLTGFFVCTAILMVSVQEQASARSVAAWVGKPRFGPHFAECFFWGEFSSEYHPSVSSVCDADFMVPLWTDNSGTKTLTFTAGAYTEGASCRAVASDPLGRFHSASAFRSIPVTDIGEYRSRTTGEVSVPTGGAFFADCIMNPYAELVEFDYAP